MYICCGFILSLFNLYFPFFLGIITYVNELETKENNILNQG